MCRLDEIVVMSNDVNCCFAFVACLVGVPLLSTMWSEC